MIAAIQPRVCHQYGVTLQGAVQMGDGRSFFPAKQFSLVQYARCVLPDSQKTGSSSGSAPARTTTQGLNSAAWNS